jgi:peptide deformylase
MPVLTIVEYPSEVLTKKCSRVDNFNKQLGKLLDDMYETMNAADGVGLAAPQVNISKQIAIVDIGDQSGRIELINPVIVKESGDQVGPEGCLSFPGLFGEVKRSYFVKIEAQDRNGSKFTIEAEDFLARALLHEIDHLHGVLFTEKVIRYYDEDDLE